MGHTCTVFWLPVFNLEISQSFPHDILNWVISKTDIIQLKPVFYSFCALHSFDSFIAVNSQIMVKLKHYFKK